MEFAEASEKLAAKCSRTPITGKNYFEVTWATSTAADEY
jgi:hypothetical protein